MCGIVAFVNFSLNDRVDILKKLELRGRDGFGYTAIDFDTFYTEKTLFTPTKYFECLSDFACEYIHFTNKEILFANTRALPTTEFQSGAGLNTVNQQPFESDKYLLVFNGLISNDKELIKEYDLKVDSKVDTAMLIPLFEKIGVIEGMKKLRGGFAIIVLNKETRQLYIGRNFLPLCYYQKDTNFCAISIKEMLPIEFQYNVKYIDSYSCIVYDVRKKKITQIYSLYPRERNKKVMIIASSGCDSTTTAYLYKHLGYEVTLVHFLYGQAAQECELFCVKKIAEDLGSNLIVIDAKPIFEPFKEVSKLLNQKEANVNVQELDAESTLSYVPARNSIFAMYVAGLAEMHGCDTVAYGGQQMDATYLDNTPDFVKKMDELLKFSLNWDTNIKFSAPLIHLIKHEIVQLGLSLGVNFNYVTACYYPKLVNGEIIACGKCGCCQFRFSAFKILGIKDPQKYEILPNKDWFKDCKDHLDVAWDISWRQSFIDNYVKEFA
jgi:7-cyano-7-deazaguanine synthase